MSSELKKFYQEVWAWVQGGCPEHRVFKKHYGLCHNLRYWSCVNEDLISEQDCLFGLSGGNVDYPFNIGHLDWACEANNGSFYKNPKRLAFIEEHAGWWR